MEHRISEEKIHKPKPWGFRLKDDVKFTYVIAHNSLM